MGHVCPPRGRSRRVEQKVVPTPVRYGLTLVLPKSGQQVGAGVPFMPGDQIGVESGKIAGRQHRCTDLGGGQAAHSGLSGPAVLQRPTLPAHVALWRPLGPGSNHVSSSPSGSARAGWADPSSPGNTSRAGKGSEPQDPRTGSGHPQSHACWLKRGAWGDGAPWGSRRPQQPAHMPTPCPAGASAGCGGPVGKCPACSVTPALSPGTNLLFLL